MPNMTPPVKTPVTPAAVKGEKQLGGFDERIVSLYARGMSTRDIQAHFEEVYGVGVVSENGK